MGARVPLSSRLRILESSGVNYQATTVLGEWSVVREMFEIRDLPEAQRMGWKGVFPTTRVRGRRRRKGHGSRVIILINASLEGNGNPLQYSCLENPTDGGAW